MGFGLIQIDKLGMLIRFGRFRICGRSEQAKQRMIEAAEQLGANAIVGMRFTTADIMGAAAEVLCYGTAVVV